MVLVASTGAFCMEQLAQACVQLLLLLLQHPISVDVGCQSARVRGGGEGGEQQPALLNASGAQSAGKLTGHTQQGRAKKGDRRTAPLVSAVCAAAPPAARPAPVAQTRRDPPGSASGAQGRRCGGPAAPTLFGAPPGHGTI